MFLKFLLAEISLLLNFDIKNRHETLKGNRVGFFFQKLIFEPVDEAKHDSIIFAV
jgi:hypothetical protein